MTPQQLFDRVAEHLIEQGCPSLSRGGSESAYINDDGYRCAIGCLIPDELYNQNWEGSGICSKRYGVQIQNAASITPDLLGIATDLQTMHDQLPLMGYYQALRSGLWDIAGKYGLIWTRDI